MYKKFIQAITWNSINIFLYKTVLLTHQIILFYFIPKSMYGTSGALFASIYLAIGFTGFGFDYSLFTYFSHYIKSKQCFRSLVPQYLMRLATIICIALGLWWLCSQNSHTRIIGFFVESIPLSLLPYLLLIYISESFKRSLETLAQLAFLNKKITTIQVSMVLCYVILFWGSYFITHQMTLHTIFVPMVIISYLEILFLLAILRVYYKTLPDQDQNCSTLPKTNIIVDQTYNYANQVGKSFFSPNFLMLIIAYNLGMHQAGAIRFFTNIITLLYMLLNRSIGVPSGALLSNMTKQAFEQVRQTFLMITNAYIQFLYALALTLAAILVPRVITYQQIEPSIAYHILLFITAGFIEYLTLTYEKLYITQKASKYLAAINLISIILLMIILYAHFALPQYLLLLPIVCIRLCTAFIVAFYAYLKWNIKPKLSISPKTMAISAILIITIKALLAGIH